MVAYEANFKDLSVIIQYNTNIININWRILIKLMYKILQNNSFLNDCYQYIIIIEVNVGQNNNKDIFTVIFIRSHPACIYCTIVFSRFTELNNKLHLFIEEIGNVNTCF